MSSALDLRAANPVAPPAGGQPDRCDNCGTTLAGPWCHGCGQRDVDHLVSVREFFTHLAEVLAGYDSRLLRTVGALLFRPGLLTAEYVAGRRVRYLPPVQVYLAAAALLFVAASFKPMVAFDPSTRAFTSAIPTLNVSDTLGMAEVERLGARGISLEVFRERFEQRTTSRLSTFLALIVPLFALLTAVVFLFDRRPFAQHVLFALHWSAFYLAVLAALQPLPLRSFGSPGLLSLVLLLAPLLYLVVAIRRAYATGWAAASIRGLLLYTGFFGILIAWLELVARYTILRM